MNSRDQLTPFTDMRLHRNSAPHDDQSTVQQVTATSKEFMASNLPAALQVAASYHYQLVPKMMALIVASNLPVSGRHPDIAAGLHKKMLQNASRPPLKSTRQSLKCWVARRRDEGTSETARSEPVSLSKEICNALDEMIDSLSIPSPGSSDVFSGNFAPVNELPPTGCKVIYGKIPACLVGGAYIRNGPNPQYLPARRRQSILEGDGMLHSLLFSTDSSGTFCSRYVKTHRYMLERKAGGPMIPGIFSGMYGFEGLGRSAVTVLRTLTGQVNFEHGIGFANTSLVFMARRIFALGESDLPYAVYVDPVSGEISTVGRFDFEGKLKIAMTAHPKKDHETGETFAYRCGFFPPFLSYFRFDMAGNKSGDVPIHSIKQASMMHDFAITENYALFLDNQIVLKPMEVILGRGICVGTDNSKVPCLRVLPRYAKDELLIKEFKLPGFNIMHSINAWEEENADGEECVVLVATNVLGMEHVIERMEHVHCCVEMLRINLRTGMVSRTPLSALNLELGVINPGYVGRQNRYAYLGIGDIYPNFAGVVKLDFSLAGKGDCVIAKRDFGPRCFSGEPFFVPNNDQKNEDDGYVMCYVHNEETGESRFIIMDACSSNLEIVVEVRLPRRVPYGIHGIFVSKSELESQCHIP